VTRKQDSAKPRMTGEDLRQMLSEDSDLLKTIIQQTVQQVLEAEMDEALQAGKSERSEHRLGYRSGYYGRTLITRVWARSSCVCRRTGKGGSARKCSSAIRGAKRRWWQRCSRCTCRACPHAR
jgi:hypothetical protein